MPSRAEKRAARIKEEIRIVDVLEHYDYDVRSDGGGREQQFSCHLHGDGHDYKPSARVYPDGESWYCFACDLTRDAIETVRTEEDLDFWGAVKLLEKRYKLPPLPWDDDDREAAKRAAQPTIAQEIGAKLRQGKTYEDDRHRMTRLLESMTKDRDLPLVDVLAYWEALDKLHWRVEKKQVSELQGRAALEGLRERLLAQIR